MIKQRILIDYVKNGEMIKEVALANNFVFRAYEIFRCKSFKKDEHLDTIIKVILTEGQELEQLQKIGKSFMLPIAILPAAGLLLGIGGALSNPVTVSAYPVLNVALLQGIFKLMASCGEVVFANLASILAVGLSECFFVMMLITPPIASLP